MFHILAFLLAAPDVEDRSLDLAIENVTVIDVETGQQRDGQTVVIDDGIIVSVSGDTVGPGDAVRTIDGSGQFLIPGLWDAHVHSVTNWSWHAPVFLAHGVTSVRNMHTSEPEGYALIRAIREQGPQGLAPRMIANGFIVGGAADPWGEIIPVSSAQEGVAAVDAHIDEGMDFVKVYGGISHEGYRALMARAAERGIPVDGHLPDGMRTQEAVRLGQRTIEHGIAFGHGCVDWDKADRLMATYERPEVQGPPGALDFMFLLRSNDEARVDEDCAALAELMAAQGTATVPTIVNGLTADARLSMATEGQESALPADMFARWSQMADSPFGAAMVTARGPVMPYVRDEIALYQAAGVTILAGTDVGNTFLAPGASLLRELELLVEAGLSNLQALQAATSAPARVFDTDALGCIAAGCKADLVLLNADPLINISNIRQISAVVLAGRYRSRTELDQDVRKALEAE